MVPGSLHLAIYRSIGLTRAEVCSLEAFGPKRTPGTRAIDLLVFDVVHKYRDAQHRCERDQVGTNMAVAERAVIGTPLRHHFVDIRERTLACDTRCKPRGRPGVVRAVIQFLVHFFRQLHSPALCNLKNGTEAFDEVDAAHRYRHAALGDKLRRPPAAGEVLRDRRMPCGRFQAGVLLFRGDLPEGLHGRFAIN